LDADGDYLEVTYRHILEDLGKQPGTLGVIFRKAQNRIQDPAKLKRLIVDLIDKENWSATGTDIKGDAYEELLSKGAEDIKSGAGQYFTPRPLIQAMVDCVRPTIRDTWLTRLRGRPGSFWPHTTSHPRTPRSSRRPSVSTCATASSMAPSWSMAPPASPR
jgi:type I restriction enzyme M protein